MKNLKEQFLSGVKRGTKIEVTFTGLNFIANEGYSVNTYTYIRIDDKFICISKNPVKDIIRFDEIEDDLSIFEPEFEDVKITKILVPIGYRTIFENESIVEMTQAEIEQALGYKIKII